MIENQEKNLYPSVFKYTLKNGLKILILEKHFVPTISFTMLFKVGNVDNIKGKTGLAHLFEHMAFKGTKTINTYNYEKEKLIIDRIEKIQNEIIKYKKENNIKKVEELNKKYILEEKKAEKYINREEFFKIYQKLGEHNLNAFTSTDYTGFVIELPSNNLENWMRIESDRFKNHVLRDFYKEKNVVLEELRMIETNPDKMMWQNLLSNAFTKHPYKNPTIGWIEDVNNLTMTDALNFYKNFYVPNNSVISIVGDVKTKETIKLIEKYFSSWNNKPLPKRNYIKEPLQKKEKIINMPFKAKPMLKMGFKIPKLNSKDTPSLMVISELLCNGKTSILYKELVEKKKIALYVNSYIGFPGDRYPSLFTIQSAPKENFTNEELDKAILNEIKKLQNKPIKEYELKKIINNYEFSLINHLESSLNFSTSMAINECLFNDWKLFWKILDKIKLLKPKDISITAKKYLNRERRSVIYLLEEK